MNTHPDLEIAHEAKACAYLEGLSRYISLFPVTYDQASTTSLLHCKGTITDYQVQVGVYGEMKPCTEQKELNFFFPIRNAISRKITLLIDTHTQAICIVNRGTYNG
jgi:hypothetical protein